MKIAWFLFFFFSFLYTKDTICLVPKNITHSILPLFSQPIPYTQMNVIIKESPVENTIAMMHQIKNSKFAIIRRDILWQVERNNESDQKNKYITIAQLPYKSQLFLFQSVEAFDTDIDLLVGKTISIGVLEDKNTEYIKKLLEFYGLVYNVSYKSISYEMSMNALKKGSVDAYFTFLPIDLNINNVHAQTLFSKELIAYFDNLGIFEIDYNGIFSPYVLIASVDATDEEIENIIYRLMEKGIFSPITDTRFGRINQYVVTHLESVKKALQTKMMKKNEKNVTLYANSVCRKYHYGFLKLLREKPKLKKKLIHLDIKQKKIYLKKINKVLLDIDAHKTECNLKYLKSKTEEFFTIKRSIKNMF